MFLLSLPMRERGLKCYRRFSYSVNAASLPMRERGLKYLPTCLFEASPSSLPMRERGLKYIGIAADEPKRVVAPHAGAWIEMIEVTDGKVHLTSLPMRERGLKY